MQRHLPEDLQRRLRHYFEFQQLKRRDDDSKVLRALTSSLRMKVASSQYSDVLQRNLYLFGGCNAQFLNQFMARCALPFPFLFLPFPSFPGRPQPPPAALKLPPKPPATASRRAL